MLIQLIEISAMMMKLFTWTGWATISPLSWLHVTITVKPGWTPGGIFIPGYPEVMFHFSFWLGWKTRTNVTLYWLTDWLNQYGGWPQFWSDGHEIWKLPSWTDFNTFLLKSSYNDSPVQCLEGWLCWLGWWCKIPAEHDAMTLKLKTKLILRLCWNKIRSITHNISN